MHGTYVYVYCMILEMYLKTGFQRLWYITPVITIKNLDKWQRPLNNLHIHILYKEKKKYLQVAYYLNFTLYEAITYIYFYNNNNNNNNLYLLSNYT
jgi:hypothetical protein